MHGWGSPGCAQVYVWGSGVQRTCVEPSDAVSCVTLAKCHLFEPLTAPSPWAQAQGLFKDSEVLHVRTWAVSGT